MPARVFKHDAVTNQRLLLHATLLICLLATTNRATAQGLLSSGEWKRNSLASERFTIYGTGGRNNPLGKSLDTPYDDNELFIRFAFRYQKDSLDSPPETSGEFFVLWLDEDESNELKHCYVYSKEFKCKS